jgi:tetratricopeptide (TPR) repeat protein
LKRAVTRLLTACRSGARNRVSSAIILLLIPCWSLRTLADETNANKAAAHKLFEQSELRYRDGRFQEAAVLLREAYALDPAPILLFNLARALESGGDLDGAVDAYTQYLEADPRARDKGAVAKRLETLRAQIKDKEDLQRVRDEDARRMQEVEHEAKLAKERPPKESSSDPWPWIVTGVGAGGLIAGVVMGYLAEKRRQEAVDEPINLQANNLAQQARSLQTGANIAYAAGGAVALGGAVWLILSQRWSDEADEGRPGPPATGRPERAHDGLRPAPPVTASVTPRSIAFTFAF